MPRQFVRAQGVWMHDSNGGRYLDFLSGCSTLNYGHTHPVLKAALTDYIADDGIAHALDLLTAAKADFLRSEEHTSELQSLMRTSYAVFCLNTTQTRPERPPLTTGPCGSNMADTQTPGTTQPEQQ